MDGSAPITTAERRGLVLRVVLANMQRCVLANADQQPGLIGALDLHAIGADVAHAGFGVFGNEVGRSKKRRGIFTHRPRRNRQFGNIDVLTVQNVFLARRFFYHPRRNRIAQRMVPLAVDAFDRFRLQAKGIDFT